MPRYAVKLPNGSKVELKLAYDGELPKIVIETVRWSLDGANFKSTKDAIDAVQDALANALAEQNAPAHGVAEHSSRRPPPKIVEGFFWLILPRKHRDAILGDAEEAYWETIAKFGSRRMATCDYCKEAAYAILFALRQGSASLLIGVMLKLRELFKWSSS